jgi:hypothetical protein
VLVRSFPAGRAELFGRLAGFEPRNFRHAGGLVISISLDSPHFGHRKEAMRRTIGQAGNLLDLFASLHQRITV